MTRARTVPPSPPKRSGRLLHVLWHNTLFCISLLLFFVGSAISLQIAFLQYKESDNRERDRIALETDQLRSNLSRELHTAFGLTEGLVALIRMQAGIEQKQFDAIIRQLANRSRLINNVGLAIGYTIQFVYPLKNNEQALGLNYETQPEQIGPVRRSIKERRMVIAGPVQLVQGGIGLIGHTPVFIGDSAESPRFWGVLSTVIRFDTLLRIAGIDTVGTPLQITLRGIDGTGSQGPVFWGDSLILSKQPVSMEIPLPSGSWQMNAIPQNGWKIFNPFRSFVFLAGIVLTTIFSVLLFIVLYISRSRASEIYRRQAAESADKIKSAFLATMSHELRTPLNSIIGFTGIILQGMVGDLTGEQRKQLGMVNDSARHLLALINDILDISKIESGQLELQKEVFPLRDALAKSLQVVGPLAEKKGLPISLPTIPDSLQLWSDRRRVEQILINLLNNAVKFTEQGAVTVSVIPDYQPVTADAAHGETTAAKGRLRISIADTGVGIQANDIDKLFKPFKQLDSGTTRRYEGTGLGLSICKRLAGMLDGDIEAHSDGPGRGSTFILTLPLTEHQNG